MSFKTRDHIIKKLLYQSCNRGCKETDLIIGEFARQNLSKMDHTELCIFAKILQLQDADIYDWYIGKKSLPEEYLNPVMINLMNFKPKKTTQE